MSGFTLIEDRVLAAPASSVVFNSGLTDFKVFRLTAFVVRDATAVNATVGVRLNGDTGSNYARQVLSASSSTVSSQRDTAQSSFSPQIGIGENDVGLVECVIQKPLTSTPARITYSIARPDTITYQTVVGEWNNTADLISSITVLLGAGNLAAGTRIVLEGAPGVAPITDAAVRLVVDGVIGDDDYGSVEPWAEDYTTVILGPIDISEVSVTDINDDEGFGFALSATVPDDNTAEVDAVPMEVAYDVAVDVALTSHTDTLERPNDTLEWTATVGGDAITQASYRVVGRLQPGNTIVYDSGVIASATQEHQIGSGTPVVAWASPQDGQVVRWTVTVTEDGTADPDGVGDNISGSEAVDLTNDWTLPTAPTGLAAVAVTEEV